jgi:hypothetical protein
VNKVAEAIAPYKKAVELHPDHFGYNFNYGLVLLDAGDLKLAAPAFCKASDAYFQGTDVHKAGCENKDALDGCYNELALKADELCIAGKVSQQSLSAAAGGPENPLDGHTFPERAQRVASHRPLCLPEEDAVTGACILPDTMTVVLTVYKRNNLLNQLQQVAKQTMQPSEIVIYQDENHVDVSSILGNFSSPLPIRHVHSTTNQRYHGRFLLPLMFSTEYTVSGDCVSSANAIPNAVP